MNGYVNERQQVRDFESSERNGDSHYVAQSSSQNADSSQRTKPLKVDDALMYLEKVREQFTNNPRVYDTFLEVMKEFKSQALNTQGVIRKVGDLFVNHPDLITGFNTFLPTGYTVQVHGNILKTIEPNGTTEITLHPELEEDEMEEEQEEARSSTNNFDEPLRVDIHSEFNPDEYHSLDEALDILNKIRDRYSNQPQTYENFLTLLGKYQQSMRSDNVDDRPNLHAKILQLFKDDSELIADFRSFLPAVFPNEREQTTKSTKTKKKTLDGMLQKKRGSSANKGLSGISLTERQMIFFEKVNLLRSVFRNETSVNAFYHALELYNQRQINRTDLFNLLSPIFAHSPTLMRTLYELLDDGENEQKPERLPLEMKVVESKAIEIDYTTTRRLGQSYREQAPEKRDAVCSGRKTKHKMVLNDNWMAFASWQSEDSAAVSSKKTPFEETLWRIEDERFDYDICESILETSLGVLTQTQAKMDALEERERRQFKLDEDYNCPTQPTLIPRCVKRIYGEHASKILSALRKSPVESVPCVRNRIEATLEEMRKDKISHSERWNEQTRACLSRSMDNQSTLFRNNDMKFLKCRTIIQDIERHYEERSKLTGTIHYNGNLPPLITLTYPREMSVFYDAHYLIECAFLATHISAEEMNTVRFILKFVLPTLLGINPYNVSTSQAIREMIDLDGYEKNPLAHSTLLNVKKFDEYIRRYYGDFQRSQNQWSNFYSTTTLFCNPNWVLFLRAHNILCERLNRVKTLCREKRAEYEHERLVEQRNREMQQKHGFNRSATNLNGIENTLDKIKHPSANETRNPAKYYEDTLDMIKMLYDSTVQQVAYEDVMRTMFGADALPLYTMDRLLNFIHKYLIAIIQDSTTTIMLNLFKTYTTHKLCLPPHKQSSEEMVYEFMSASVLSDTTCIRTTSVITDQPVIMFEMIEAPVISDWYETYSKSLMDQSRKFVIPNKIDLTFLDDARAILPRKRSKMFLKRNLYRGARRLRTYKILGNALIEEEPEESRDSTPSEDDEEDLENQSPMDTTVPEPEITESEPIVSASRVNTLLPKVPDPTDRKTTSFLVFDGIHSFSINSSFGFFSKHVGKFGLLLRRGAPYRGQKQSTRRTTKEQLELVISRLSESRMEVEV
ncbi:hypothetical protein M3Y94_01321600 [Aphelenchoides besseyi]|nr:hypothetical protein M3Y94_01321600 [Aphelenchoides besseyi]KAI6225676.1 HDAC-interact domain-containing protein [Aphelenchoides besseyi]